MGDKIRFGIIGGMAGPLNAEHLGISRKQRLLHSVT